MSDVALAFWRGRTDKQASGGQRPPSSSASYRPIVAAREGLRVVTVGGQAELQNPSNELGPADGSVLLIRPDGYVGATFDASGCHPIDDHLAMALPSANARSAKALYIAAGIR